MRLSCDYAQYDINISNYHFPGYTAAIKVLHDFNVTSQATFTIPEYMTFTIDSGKKLSNYGTVKNGGTVENVNGGSVEGPGNWQSPVTP